VSAHLVERGGTVDGSSTIPAVELRGITKVFPGVVANDSIDLDLYHGEVHCLLGENGAGKTTLMQILSGMYRPDGGTIAIDGRQVAIRSPHAAIARGVGMVYQHPTLVPTFTVIENLLLGNKDHFRLARKRALASIREHADQLGTAFDPDAVVGRLTLGRQQQVEIIKALWSEPRVLILDEPTSMLTPPEVSDLVQVLQSITAQGLAVVVITHKLREALETGDRITVLREGRVVDRITPEQLRSGDPLKLQNSIVRAMFGDEAVPVGEVVELGRSELAAHVRRGLPAHVVLEADRLSVKPGPQEVGVSGVSFAVREGEIFGIAGVDGNGQRELAEALAGQRHVAHGVIRLDGKDVTRASVGERQRLGLGYVTDDRLGEGAVPSLSLSLNLLLKRIGEQPFWTRARRISRPAVEETARRLTDEFDIRTPDVNTRVGTLSGGNIQKMMLARELSSHPKVVVYSNPTHGLDLKTTLDVRRKVRDLSAQEGTAAVVISTDLDELVDLCDRVGVMSRGRLVGIVENAGPRVEEKVGELMMTGGGEWR
jgi:general nucleoside transport system ATP-binding protein